MMTNSFKVLHFKDILKKAFCAALQKEKKGLETSGLNVASKSYSGVES